MAVISLEPKYSPTEYQDSLDERQEFRSYTITYMALVSSSSDSAALVARSLPDYGTAYSYAGVTDKDATLKRRDVRQIGIKEYEATCTWDTSTKAGSDEDQGPLTEPPKRSWTTVSEDFYPNVDLDNKPIVNSAGYAPENGIAITRHYSVYRLTRNEAFFNTEMAAQYVDAVNAGYWRGQADGCAKILGINADEQYWAPKKLWYATVTYEVVVNPAGWDVLAIDKGPYCWVKNESSGLYERKWTDTNSETGTEVTREVYLDGRGAELSDARVQAGRYEWNRFKVHRRLNFGALRI
jgi:hypothetical protein